MSKTVDCRNDELSQWDVETYRNLIRIDLTPGEAEVITNPTVVFPQEKDIVAVHWHPEQVPVELVRQRLATMFPGKGNELIIPTQHNILMSYDDFCGVEVDCHSRDFHRKVQLLLHFSCEKAAKADHLRSMLAHTFKYRSEQLFEFVDTVIDPKYHHLLHSAISAGEADPEVVSFAVTVVGKFRCLLDRFLGETSPLAIKNKLLMNYVEAHMNPENEHLVRKVLVFLREVKQIVKLNFVLDYFFETREVIEEVRSLGGGIVIPHPEQFWPVLLADYDVDGYEVWNPQSREFTEFLISVLNRKNESPRYHHRRLLVFMGDDTHFSEKLKRPKDQDPDKATREVGLQPAWNERAIRKALILGQHSRESLIEEYRKRLSQ
jgi:hypothetical protein